MIKTRVDFELRCSHRVFLGSLCYWATMTSMAAPVELVTGTAARLPVTTMSTVKLRILSLMTWGAGGRGTR